MDVYTFTYSDGYNIPDIHGWNYYLMDDFLCIVYILFMVPGMAMFCIDCSPIVLCRRYADYLRSCAAVNFYGQPISVDDGCAMRKCGSWDVQWLRDDVR